MRMPAEWAPHERTLMGWPVPARAVGRADRAGARRTTPRSRTRSPRFEPVTMVAADAGDAELARAAVRRRRRASSSCRSTTRGCATPARSSSYGADGRRRRGPLPLQRAGARSSRRGTTTRPSAARSPRRLGDDRSSRRRSCSRAARSSVDGDGHAGHDRAVPAEPEPQPGAVARARSRQALRRLARRRADRVARPTGSSRTTTPTATSTSSPRSPRPGRSLLQRLRRRATRTTTTRGEPPRALRAGRDSTCIEVPVLPYARSARRDGRGAPT